MDSCYGRKMILEFLDGVLTAFDDNFRFSVCEI